MNKKLALTTLALAAILTLTGCGNTDAQPEPTTPAPTQTTPAPETEPTPSTPEAEEVIVIEVVDGSATLPNGESVSCPDSPSVVVKEDGTFACATAETVDW